jgi:hypothetical protein
MLFRGAMALSPSRMLLALALACAGCPAPKMSGDAGTLADLSVATDLCMFSSCDPDCPQGTMAPPFYVQNGALSCNQIGKQCTYFESGITCLCDHHWWYTDCGWRPCPQPDGGLPTCKP